jgi:hypothetical protein
MEKASTLVKVQASTVELGKSLLALGIQNEKAKRSNDSKGDSFECSKLDVRSQG